MKRQIELIRTAVAVMLAALALAAIVWTLVLASPATDPPILATLTPPGVPTDDPYPAPPTPPGEYPGPEAYPFPSFLPYVNDSYPYP